jgi:glycosyltransferase involved in cell wall biosynthesis
VHWLGWRKDPPQVLPAFDVTALTSLDEGTPVSLIESLASGTPVVSMAVGGVPEILEGGELGRLVHSASDDEVADAIESVLASPPSGEDAERARILVLERFSIGRLARDIERLYEDALERADGLQGDRA